MLPLLLLAEVTVPRLPPLLAVDVLSFSQSWDLAEEMSDTLLSKISVRRLAREREANMATCRLS